MKKIAIEEHWKLEDVDNVAERLEDMDEGGIDMQILSATMNFDDPRNKAAADAAKWAVDTNNAFYKIIRKYPTRFASFAAITLNDPQAAARELERAVKDLGFKGTMIGQEVPGRYLDESDYRGVLEMAERLDVPIYLHPSLPAPNMIKPYLEYPILSRSMWGFAAQTGLHAMRMICGGIFDRFPELKIILGHMGENIPYQLWRLDNRWKQEKDGRPGGFDTDPSSNLKKTPSQYFKENFYITTSGMFWHPVLQFACSVLGSDRVLFAVDYFFESNKVASNFIESAPLSRADKEKICHLNAEKLLRIPG